MTIVFWQGNKIHELDRSQSDRSLLDYLRLQAGVHSVKEGCAQGDCGACAVVLVCSSDKSLRRSSDNSLRRSSDNNLQHSSDTTQLQIRAVNACIKPLISVDQSLVFCASDLQPEHPVIQSMLKTDSSQCGFCTPGFVMSLYAAFLQAAQQAEPCVKDREKAIEIFSGNLCRCTGYVSLIEAALTLGEQTKPDIDWLAVVHKGLDALGANADHSIYRPLGHSIDDSESRPINSASAQPMSPLEACLRAKAASPKAWFVAGATDLGLHLSRKHEKPEALLDLCRIPELMISHHDESGWRIGAARPLQLVFDEMLSEWPELQDYAARFAGRPIRSSASLGGNLASASPIGDCIPLLWVLDAQLRLMSWDRHADMICDRELKLDHFIKGYRQTDLGIGELIESIWIPTSSKGLQLHARKISKRWEDDISSVSMVAAFSVNANRVFERLSIAFGGVAEQVIRIHALESLLLGRIISEPLLLEAGDVLQKMVRPIDDARASAAYRRAICHELFEEFITIAMAQSTANSKELSH